MDHTPPPFSIVTVAIVLRVFRELLSAVGGKTWLQARVRSQEERQYDMANVTACCVGICSQADSMTWSMPQPVGICSQADSMAWSMSQPVVLASIARQTL